MAIDPSSISNIGLSGPDPVGATLKGYQLKDVMDQTQIQGMKLKKEQQDTAEDQQIRQLAGKYDLTNPDQMQKYAADVSRINPRKGMDTLRQSQELQSSKNTLDLDQYKLYDAKFGLIGETLAPLKQAADDLRARGATPQQIDAALLPQATQAIQALKSKTLPNGRPVLEEQEVQAASQALQQGNLGATLDTYVMHSQKAREAITAGLQQQNIRSEIAHRTTEEGIQRERLGIQREAAKSKTAAFSGPEGDLMAALAERGVTLPAGLRSQAQQHAMMSSLIKRHPEMSPDEIAEKIETGQIDFKAEAKETQIAAGISGKIRFAEGEIKRLVPIVKEAANKVPRGKFVPWNKLKLMAESQISDPDVKKLKAYMTTIANAYDVLAARGGTDMEKRKHNREMFETADGPEALQAAMDAVQTEAAVSGEAAEEAMHRRSTPTPQAGPAAPPSGGGGGGGGGAPTETKSEADYNALPKGATYRMPGDPPGSHRVKQ